MLQRIITPENNYDGINVWIRDNNIKKVLVVSGGSIKRQVGLKAYLNQLVKNAIK